MPTGSPSQTSAVPTDLPWDRVVNDFRRVCILRRAARFEEAKQVLEAELPLSIAAWSRDEQGDAASKKQRLQQMFEFERRRLEDGWAMERTLREQVKLEVMAELKASMTAELERQARVWFDAWSKSQPQVSPSQESSTMAKPAMIHQHLQQTTSSLETAGSTPVSWHSNAERPPLSLSSTKQDHSEAFASRPTSVPNQPLSPVFAATPIASRDAIHSPSAPPRKPGFDDIAGALDWILKEQEELGLKILDASSEADSESNAQMTLSSTIP